MKKVFLSIVLLSAIGFTSCKTEVKSEKKTEVAKNVVYQCPMNCENGKSYSEEGKCPVCAMSLKAKEVSLDQSEHEHKE